VKIKLVMEWLDVCSGCEISFLDIHEKILELLDKIEIVYCPVLMDVKNYPEHADIALISGSVSNEKDEKLVKKLREIADMVIAFGTCACFGGVQGLANLYTAEEILKKVYMETAGVDNPEGIFPHKHIPKLLDSSLPLSRVIEVDYMLPGCPPPPELIFKTLTALVEGKKPQLPLKSVCDECPLKKENKRLENLKRWYESSSGINPEKCLLEQGFLCLGPATRGGCGAKCPSALVPCRGCMGPTAKSLDQAADMIGAIASIIEAEPEAILKAIADPVGMFYRFTLPASISGELVEAYKKARKKR